MKTCVSVCSFMDHTFDILPRKTWPDPTPQRFSLLFSSSSFIVLSFTFRSLPFKLIFIHGLKCESEVVFCVILHSDIQ